MDVFESVLRKLSLTTPIRRVESEINFSRIYFLVSRRDFAGINHVGLAAAEGLTVGPEVGIGTEGEDFGRVNGAFGIVGTGRAGLKRVGTSTAATSVGTGGTVKNEFSSEDWAGDGESFVARKSVRVVIIGAGVDLVIAIIFIENQPGIDVGDVAGDIDFLSEDEDLWEIIHGIVGLMGDINVAIDGEGAIDIHGESIHEFFAGGIAPCDEVAATIELIEISGTIHGAEAGVSLVIELRKAEIVLRRGFIRGEAGDGIAGISDDGIAEAGFETGENGGADAGDAGIAWPILIVSDSHVANIANARDY